MEKLNNTAKVLNELYKALDSITETEVVNLLVEADNVESTINMASSFTTNLSEFERQNEVIAGYRVMNSVICTLKNRIEDVSDKLYDITRQLHEII